MRIRDYVTGRVVAWAIIALLGAWFGIGRADAQTYTSCYAVAQQGALCPNKGEAYTQAKLAAEDRNTRLYPDKGYVVQFQAENINAAFMQSAVFYGIKRPDVAGWIDNASRNWPSDAGCPPPTVWDDVGKTCHNPQTCLDKAPMSSGSISATATSGCVDGCAFAPPAGEGPVTMSFNGVAFVAITKGWEPTGAACAADAPPPSQDQQCKPLSDGQTACAKPNGDVCYSHNGQTSQICWKPGETGEKTDGPDKQVVNAGNDPIPPNLNQPNGDTLQPDGPPINTTINNDNRVINTTNQNYTTEHGTNAGPGPGQGEPGDGTGGPSDGNGDGEADGEGEGEGDDEGSVTGGATCDAPPVCTGPALLCGVILQTYLVRCAAEGAWDEVLDMPFDESNGLEAWNPNDLFKEEAASTETLDKAGFGWGRSCPAPPEFFGTTLELNEFCSIMQMIGLIVLAMGTLHSVYAMRGSA